MPSGIGVTFPSRRTLQRVRRVGVSLWRRRADDHGERDPLDFEFALDRPRLSTRTIDEVRAALLRHAEVRSAYVARERLLKGGRDHRRGRLVTTRVRLAVDVDFASSDVATAHETFRRVTEDASDILVRETGHAGTSLADPPIRRDDLLLFDRRERR